MNTDNQSASQTNINDVANNNQPTNQTTNQININNVANNNQNNVINRRYNTDKKYNDRTIINK